MNHWRLRELRRIAEISIDRQGLLDHSQRYAVPTEINSELSIIPEHEIFAERILSRVSPRALRCSGAPTACAVEDSRICPPL